MTIVSAFTVISASQDKVRDTFLDWPNITKWDKTYMKTLTPLTSSGQIDLLQPTGKLVTTGDKVHGTFWGGEADLEILENTQSILRWKGIWHGLVAVRSFEYVEVRDGVDSGKTRFTQSEEANGFMGGVLVVDGWMGGNLRKKFVTFNQDLKEFCEKVV